MRQPVLQSLGQGPLQSRHSGPNPCTPLLHPSDDLTSVRRGDTRLKLPHNPERFTQYVHVLGSEGVSSGKHSWEVGGHPLWYGGVAKESVDRKGENSLSPEDGIWCLRHYDENYSNGSGETVTVKKSPQRTRVQLDDDGGRGPYDPEDTTRISTQTLSLKLFPWFIVGEAGEAQTADVKMCQTDISL